jgi:nucleotidyltransferase/DNA polymerase involved in DNA repair
MIPGHLASDLSSPYPRHLRSSPGFSSLYENLDSGCGSPEVHDYCYQQVSIDDVFLDISPLGNLHAAGSYADQFQTAILMKLDLRCSMGIEQCKLVAKIASDFKKPGDITVVESARIEEFRTLILVRKIPGIGRKTDLLLLDLGIRTFGDLATYDIRKLAVVLVAALKHYIKLRLGSTELKWKIAKR